MKEAVMDEREACAKIADERAALYRAELHERFPNYYPTFGVDAEWLECAAGVAEAIAAEIRARP